MVNGRVREGRCVSTAKIPALRKDWLARWEKNILNDARNRYCDREMGEEIGWLVSPFLNGFYYGYLATHDRKWVDLLVDWADAWIKRGVKEPDGYTGWPKADGASTSVMPGLYTDNMLGEAMGLRPVVLMAGTILKTPALKTKHGRKAERLHPPGRADLREVGPARLLARGEGRRALGRSAFRHRPPDRRVDRRVRSGETRTASPCRPISRTSSPSGCWRCTRRRRNPSTASGRRSGGG